MKRISRLVCTAIVGLIVPVSALHAADAATPTVLLPADMKWVANPAATGVLTAVAWGDPAKGAHGAFHKFVSGFTAPLHTHSGNTKIVVLSGTMSMSDKDGKVLKLTAGSFYTQPNTYAHVTTCVAGAECMVYLEADAAWDLKPVAPAQK